MLYDINDENIKTNLYNYQSEPLEKYSYIHNPSIKETFKAAFRQENTLGSLFNAIDFYEESELDENFNPFEYISGYESYADSFIDANSLRDVEHIKSTIDKELQDKQTLADAGGLGIVASISAGTLDPINLVPVAGATTKAYKIGKIGKGVLNAATAGAVGTAMSETALHATQETRTLEESAMAIGGATMLSGVLGGAVSALKGYDVNAPMRNNIKVLDSHVEKWNKATDENGDIIRQSSVGAKQVEDLTLENTQLVSAYGLEEKLSFVDPVLRTANSASLNTRMIAEELVETNLQKVKNQEGIATAVPVESLIKMRNANLYNGLKALDGLYTKYKLGRPKSEGVIGATLDSINADLYFRKELKRKTFYEMVGDAMRNGDKSDIEEISQAAQEIRKNIFDPLKEEAIKLGIFGEDVSVETAESYLPRLYNREKIIQNRQQFKEIVKKYLFEEELKTSDVLGEEQLYKLNESADSIIENILGQSVAGRTYLEDTTKEGKRFLTNNILINRGPFKGRVFNIPDSAIKDYLESDIEVIAQRHIRTLVPDIELYNKFGSVEMTEQLKGIEKDYQAMYEKLYEKSIVDKQTEKTLNTNKPMKSLGDIRHMINGAKKDYKEILEGKFNDSRDISKITDEEFDYIKDSNVELYNKLKEGDNVGFEDMLIVRDELANKYSKQFDNVEELLHKGKSKDIAPSIKEAIQKSANKRAFIKHRDLLPEIAQEQALSIKLSKKQSELMDKVLEQFGTTQKDFLQDAEGFFKAFKASDPEFFNEIKPLLDTLVSKYEHNLEAFKKLDIKRQEAIRQRDLVLTTNEKVKQIYADLNKSKQRDIQDLENMRDRIRGTYALPNDPNGYLYRSSKSVKTINFVTMLGGTAISALTDIAAPMMSHGVLNTLGSGYIPMIRNFKRYRLAGEEIKQMGTALDMVLNTRGLALSDVMDGYGRGSKFERGLDLISEKFSKVSGMSPWNATMKQLTGTITQSRVLDEIDNLVQGVGKKKYATRLAQLGIDREMAQRIDAQFKAHGSTEDGIKLSNFNDWEDLEASTVYRAAIIKEVDRIIITPGQDKPFWLSTPMGSVIGQFKTFGIAANQRILLAGLQRKDAEFFSGAMVMIALGGMVDYIKTYQSRNSSNFSKEKWNTYGDNPADLVVNALDRSGLFGFLFDINNTIEKLSENTLGLAALTGGETGRYSSRNKWGAVAGPTFGTGEEIFNILGSGLTATLGDGEWKESDTKSLRRMIPFQNLFYMRGLFDKVQQGINDTFGIK